MKITSETENMTLLFGGVIAALIVGVVGGSFAAHVGMADMPGMSTGKGSVSTPHGRHARDVDGSDWDSCHSRGDAAVDRSPDRSGWLYSLGTRDPRGRHRGVR